MYLSEGVLLPSVFQLSVSYQTSVGFTVNTRPMMQRMLPAICSCDIFDSPPFNTSQG